MKCKVYGGRRHSSSFIAQLCNESQILLSKCLYFSYLYFVAYILLSRESNQCVIRAHLGVVGRLSTTPRWGNPARCLSQQRNEQTCWFVLDTVFLLLNIKQRSCKYQFLSHWFGPTGNQTEVSSSRGRRFYHSAICDKGNVDQITARIKAATCDC